MRPSWHELRRQQKRHAAELESSSQSQSQLEAAASKVPANAYAPDAAEGAASEICEDSPAFDYEKPDSDEEFIAAGGADLPIAGGLATPPADDDDAGADADMEVEEDVFCRWLERAEFAVGGLVARWWTRLGSDEVPFGDEGRKLSLVSCSTEVREGAEAVSVSLPY